MELNKKHECFVHLEVVFVFGITGMGVRWGARILRMLFYLPVIRLTLFPDFNTNQGYLMIKDVVFTQ